jgi:hypothetical protein
MTDRTLEGARRSRRESSALLAGRVPIRLRSQLLVVTIYVNNLRPGWGPP